VALESTEKHPSAAACFLSAQEGNDPELSFPGTGWHKLILRWE